MEYEPVIGLEVHVEIKTRSKVFCACRNDFHSAPNTNVCPVCLGMPGVLPVLNMAMVDASMAVGLALNCTISRWSKMDRKNYFYPDLAKSYQISQYDLPLCHDGHLDVEVNGGTKRVGITRAHVEEDTARNTHTLGGGVSGVDFNRSGVPLLEIVTEPEIFSAEEAYAYLTALKQILEYLDVSDCNMEEGSLRAEPNISIRPKGVTELGVKTEVKNVASFSGVQKAIEFEVKRQVKALESGETIVQETRGWDADRGITVAQRAKESAHDYRYFPDPDLMPVHIDDDWIERIRAEIPEMPLDKQRRFMEEYDLPYSSTAPLCPDRELCDFFEQTVEKCNQPKKAVNWIVNDLLRELSAAGNENGPMPLTESKVAPDHLAELVSLVEDGSISSNIAKEIFPDVFATGKMPATIVEEKGLKQTSDTGELESICSQVMTEHPKAVEEFKGGKGNAINALKGQVMKATRGQANPKLVDEILRKLLAS